MLLYPRAVAMPFLQSLQTPGGWQLIDDLCFRHTLGTTLRLTPLQHPAVFELILEYQDVESADPVGFSFEPSLCDVSMSVFLTCLHLEGPVTLDAFQAALVEQIGCIASARFRALSHVLAQRFGPGSWQYEQDLDWIAPPGSQHYTKCSSFPALYPLLQRWNLQHFLSNGTFTTPWAMPLVLYPSHHTALMQSDHLAWAHTVLD